jgi:hypothetical protein
MSRMKTTAGLAILAGALGTAACGGDNLFAGPGTSSQAPPVVTSIEAPFSVNAGSTLDIRVRAVAPRGMSEVTLRYRHALVQEQGYPFNGSTDTVTVDATIQVPVTPQDSILVIEAFASDVAGRVSGIRSDTVRINTSLPSPVALAPAARPRSAQRPAASSVADPTFTAGAPTP